jgi:hypothetical protein
MQVKILFCGILSQYSTRNHTVESISANVHSVVACHIFHWKYMCVCARACVSDWLKTLLRNIFVLLFIEKWHALHRQKFCDSVCVYVCARMCACVWFLYKSMALICPCVAHGIHACPHSISKDTNAASMFHPSGIHSLCPNVAISGNPTGRDHTRSDWCLILLDSVCFIMSFFAFLFPFMDGGWSVFSNFR